MILNVLVHKYFSSIEHILFKLLMEENNQYYWKLFGTTYCL